MLMYVFYRLHVARKSFPADFAMMKLPVMDIHLIEKVWKRLFVLFVKQSSQSNNLVPTVASFLDKYFINHTNYYKHVASSLFIIILFLVLLWRVQINRR